MNFDLKKTEKIVQYSGLIIFLAILTQIDISKVFHIILNLNFFDFTVSILLFFPLLLMKSLRWRSLMNSFNIKYSVKDSMIIYSAATFLGAITPGYIGDFIKVIYLKNDGHPFSKSFSSTLLDRLFDIIAIMLFSLVGSLLIAKLYTRHIEYLYSFLILFAILSISILIFYYVKKLERFANTLVPAILIKLLPQKQKEYANNYYSEIYTCIFSIGVKNILYAVMLTSIGCTINFAMAYLVALSINLNISFLYLAACVSISTAITFIPISISGIGTRDATLIILFSQIGISMESAIAFSSAMLMMQLMLIAITLVAWLIKPISLSSIRKTA